MVRLLSFVSHASLAKAAILAGNGILMERQSPDTTTADGLTTLGYTSHHEIEGTTTWSEVSYATANVYITSSGDFFTVCDYMNSYSTTTFGTTYSDTLLTVSTQCPMFTSCSSGTPVGDGVSTTCSSGYICASMLWYDKYGDTSARTEIFCPSVTTASNLSTVTAMYATRPPGIVSVATATTTNSVSSNTPSPGSSPTGPTATSTSTSGSSGSKSNNAGIIAGGVVGGLAVLALAGVATLWILKRNRREPPAPYPPGSAAGPAPYGHYEPDKAHDVPEYNPHMSMSYSGMTAGEHPGTHSPVPMYAEGFHRGELSGVRSPIQ